MSDDESDVPVLKIKGRIRVPVPTTKIKGRIRVAPKPMLSPYERFSKCKQTITITYSECAENHVGMQKIGKLADRGLTLEKLKQLEKHFRGLGHVTELTLLAEQAGVCDIVDQTSNEASILIVRGGVSSLVAGATIDDLYHEQSGLEQDTKAKMYGRVVNKHARYNLCFDDESQEPDYEEGKGRIVSFSDVPLTNAMRQELMRLMEGDLPGALKAEGNYYYDVTKTGIGYHSDLERKIVIAVRLGSDMPLHFYWYHRSQRVGERVDFMLKHGDVYFMNEKATGNDGRRRTIYTLRHAAGCRKYTD